MILSPSLVLDFRYGIARINTTSYSGFLDHPFDYSQFGISPDLQAINPFPNGPPDVTVGGRYATFRREPPAGPIRISTKPIITWSAA